MICEKKWFLLLVVFLFSNFLSAENACIVIDETKDQLTESDRKAAKFHFEFTLKKEGYTINDADCKEKFVVFHAKLGESITAFIESPKGARDMTAKNVEDLPNIYSQILKSLTIGVASGDLSATTRTTVTSKQTENPKRVAAEGLFYGRIGYGLITDAGNKSGAFLGLGYRLELDKFGIDFSALNISINGGSDDKSSFDMELVKIGALYFLSKDEPESFYFGGGASYGLSDIYNDKKTYKGSGVRAAITGGYEILRTSNVRFFIQSDLVLPFYKCKEYYETEDGDEKITADGGAKYSPTIVISIGIGRGRRS